MRTLAEAALLRDGLSTHSWVTFLALHTAARTDGTVIETLRALAAATGSGTRSLHRLLDELAQRGLIECESLSPSEVRVTVL